MYKGAIVVVHNTVGSIAGLVSNGKCGHVSRSTMDMLLHTKAENKNSWSKRKPIQ